MENTTISISSKEIGKELDYYVLFMSYDLDLKGYLTIEEYTILWNSICSKHIEFIPNIIKEICIDFSHLKESELLTLQDILIKYINHQINEKKILLIYTELKNKNQYLNSEEFNKSFQFIINKYIILPVKQKAIKFLTQLNNNKLKDII